MNGSGSPSGAIDQGHPPSEAEFDSMVLRILAGKQPVDGKS
jgi:hypothetical protein